MMFLVSVSLPMLMLLCWVPRSHMLPSVKFLVEVALLELKLTALVP